MSSLIRIIRPASAIESNPVTSILQLLQRNGIAIETLCGGRAQCGRCQIRILKGGDRMNSRNEAETRRLSVLGAAEDIRLACQSFCRGDIEIEIVNPGAPQQD